MSSPQNYPFLPPNLAREAARNNQMMEGAAAARAAQQAGTGFAPRPAWRRKWIRGLIAVFVAVVFLVEVPVELVQGRVWPAICFAVLCFFIGSAASRCLRRPR
jgi:uncharacterized MAPEG superfamily protein